MIDACIAGVLHYAEDTGLIEADDRLWARNRLLEALQLDGCDPDCAPAELPLAVSFGCMAPQKTRQDFSRRVFCYFFYGSLISGLQYNRQAVSELPLS